MMFAITVENWEAATGLLVIACGWGLRYWQIFLADRRDRAGEAARLTVLRDIAASNAAIREGQTRQNGKLSEVVAVNAIYHAELIRTLELCQRKCKNL